LFVSVTRAAIAGVIARKLLLKKSNISGCTVVSCSNANTHFIQIRKGNHLNLKHYEFNHSIFKKTDKNNR
jgi:hypothetical protein